jgi:hypothetical protein
MGKASISKHVERVKIALAGLHILARCYGEVYDDVHNAMRYIVRSSHALIIEPSLCTFFLCVALSAQPIPLLVPADSFFIMMDQWANEQESELPSLGQCSPSRMGAAFCFCDNSHRSCLQVCR